MLVLSAARLSAGLHRLSIAQVLLRDHFKYYVIKEVGGWGQKMAIFDDLQHCKSSKRQVSGSKKGKNMMM